MLNFDEPRFLAIQSGAVALAPRIDAAVAAALEAGAPNIHILGTGGAAILMKPAVQLLRRRSAFPVFDDPTAELLAGGSRNLLPGSLVVIPSLSGTTPESVAMLELARERGATVIALVGDGATPLGRGADHAVVNPAADDTSSETFYVQSQLIALSVLRHRSEVANYDALVEELRALPRQLLRLKQAIEPRAPELARVLAEKDWHIVTGAGNAWPQAFYYGMCILEEMQWIRTRPVHASDFFHGTLELVEDGVSVLLLKGEDEARPLAERVERFVPTVGGRLTVLDTAEFPTLGLSPELRAHLSPAFLATMLERVSAHLEVLRGHPLTTRRYYRRVQY
jgi:fructoselysine-6-phosphate deglycase